LQSFLRQLPDYIAIAEIDSWSLAEAVQRKMHWYRKRHEVVDIIAICEEDIIAFDMTNQISQKT
jgi:hypothetical protein